ncbi:MAG: family 16 glycosylhydrolase [Gammaproteobacteria bacterium]
MIKNKATQDSGYRVGRRNPIVRIAIGLMMLAAVFQAAHAAPIYADGDVGPLGAPDGRVDGADQLIIGRILTDEVTPTELEYSHGDVYPVGAPDGVLNVQDLLLIQQLALGQGAGNYVQNLDLFADGPATFTVDINGTIGSTDLVVGGYIGPGASVINDASFAEPADPSNTVWRVSVSGGVGNVFMGTGDLTSDPVLDSGFDLSGPGGQLVFDIKVVSISPGAVLTVKIDSGYPELGQAALTPSQYAVGSWRRVAIDFATLLADPGPGPGLDLENVVNAFVIEVTGGDAEFYLDNIFITHACGQVDGCSATVKTKPVIDYELVWSDEFDGTSLSTDNWQYETGYGDFGWGNDEWQLYTSDPANVSVAGGNLVIAAQCANPPNCGKRNGTITSARINTLNKFAFKYGRVEARIKPPVGEGAWSAFWMLGKNFPFVGWPFSGEIDIVEIFTGQSNEYTTHFTLHWCDETNQNSGPTTCFPQFNGWTYNTQSRVDFSESLGDDFHVFSADWDENGMTGKIDGIPYFFLSIDPGTMDEFLEEFFMILNVAIGGNLGGAPDATTPWPQTMLVDYVRVYQVVGGNGTYSIGPPPLAPELGIYSESHTQSSVPLNITNGADFGGNVLSIDTASTSVAPFDGSLSMEVIYNNTGRSFSGFLFGLGGGQDVSSYQTLKFSIDQSAMPNMANMNIELENPGSQKFIAQLANYTPTVSGNWATYEIPLGDFIGADLTNIVYLGFWQPRTSGGSLTFGTLYYDDIHFAGGQ